MITDNKQKQQEIDKQINEEITVFSSSKFEGEIPDGFRDLFFRAIMFIPPITHQWHSEALMKIKNKEVGKFTNLEVGLMVNTLMATPPVNLFDNFEDTMFYLGKLEAMSRAYNEASSKFKQELEGKRFRLMQLNGLTANTLPFTRAIKQ